MRLHRSSIARLMAEIADDQAKAGDREAALRTLREMAETAIAARPWPVEPPNVSAVISSGHALIQVARAQGDYVLARASFEESLSVRREMGDRRGAASTLTLLGNLAIFGGLSLFYRHKRFDGQVWWLYVLSYGALRLGVEFFRGDYYTLTPDARSLVPDGDVAGRLEDMIARPEAYWDAVANVRAHLAEHHSYERRFEELLGVLGS